MFLSLISGSSGNATLVTEGDTLILVDCGMSGKRLAAAMSELDLSCNDINAILLTHEHIDHTQGVGVISRRFDIPIYATEGTHSSASIGKVEDRNISLISPMKSFEIGDIGVCPFTISHDAKDPVGFNFFTKHQKLSLATDLGEVTDEIRQSLLGSDEIILESNHDEDMLMYGSYPFNLKQRILGRYGHLSNTTAAELAVYLLKNGTKKIMLGHLSQENNTPAIAYQAAESALTGVGAAIGRDVFLSVADRYGITRFA